jgi:hypothetical protein
MTRTLGAAPGMWPHVGVVDLGELRGRGCGRTSEEIDLRMGRGACGGEKKTEQEEIFLPKAVKALATCRGWQHPSAWKASRTLPKGEDVEEASNRLSGRHKGSAFIIKKYSCYAMTSLIYF